MGTIGSGSLRSSAGGRYSADIYLYSAHTGTTNRGITATVSGSGGDFIANDLPRSPLLVNFTLAAADVTPLS